MHFQLSSDVDGTPMVTIAGELDITTVAGLDEALAATLERRPAKLVVDLTEVGFADSSAIAQWVRWATLVGTLELRHPAPLLRAVISRMGLAETLQIEP